MSQNSFIPTGSETHLDARAVWNGNATDAESRLTSLESGSARAVDSVNTQTGVVVLDADDIDDSATTNKFATQGELDKANTALQPTDPTLASVTTNGATTVNNISVGTIATLHPTNTANDNVATGQQSASIGGRRNIASGTRATTFGGVSNTVSGTDSTAVGGNNQEVIGVESEALGSTNLFLYTKYTSALGTANSKVGLATSAATSVEAKHSVIVGGEAQTIEDAAYAAILGGAVNKVLSTHDRSVILGGANIISDASDTAYVQNLNVKSAVKIPTGAADTYVLTSDANGVGTWQAKEIVTPQVVLENGVQILDWDHALGSTIKHTLTDDVFSINITNVVDGDSGLIILRQDGNGPWTYSGSGSVGGGSASEKILSGDLASIATVLTGEVITLGWFYDGQANLIYYYVSDID